MLCRPAKQELPGIIWNILWLFFCPPRLLLQFESGCNAGRIFQFSFGILKNLAIIQSKKLQPRINMPLIKRSIEKKTFINKQFLELLPIRYDRILLVIKS